MPYRPLLSLFAALLLCVGQPLSATSILELKSGAQVRGEILAERADRVVVDLGFTVLSVPREEIDRIQNPETAEGDDVVEASGGDLFRAESSLTTLPVQENVARVGGAVVLIRTPIGLGSGFIIHRDGYVVTNHHVVAGEHNVSVTLFRRTANELERVNFNNVRIVAMDARLDLALLKIMDADAIFPTVPLGDSQSLHEGQGVFAIGSPLGLDRTVSQGIISSKNRLLEGQLYLQTTTQINPGNSGGPLFNLRGEVVGVNNMKAMQVGIEGLNFAIPVTVLKTFLRNRDAFAFDPRNANAGFRYLAPARQDAESSALDATEAR